jgi:hypothetical protein
MTAVITKYLQSTLGPAKEETFLRHTRLCEPCRRQLDELASVAKQPDEATPEDTTADSHHE